MKLRFEPLTRRHDRSAFVCGSKSLDDWFRTRAGQDDRRNVARVFVAIDDDDEGIVGFYSLSMFALALDDLPEDLARKLPHYDAIPAALIGRLARHERAKGRGLSEILISDAIVRVLSAVTSVAAYAIVVDAIDEHAGRFYERFGFIGFPRRRNRLFMLAETAGVGLARAHTRK